MTLRCFPYERWYTQKAVESVADMQELPESDLAELGLFPIDIKNLAAARAMGMLNYAVMLLALSRKIGMDRQGLIEWVHQHYIERGHYDEWIIANGSGNVDAFLRDFLYGRRLLYDKSTVQALEQGGYEVTTPLWYYQEPPEAFFYFDVDPTEFSEYALLLATSNASRLGIDLQVTHKDNVEHALIRGLSPQTTTNIDLSRHDAHTQGITSTTYYIRAKNANDLPCVEHLLQKRWGGTSMISRGVTYDALHAPALIAEKDGECYGLLTYHVNHSECEILTLDAVVPFQGVGTALIEKLIEQGKNEGYRRLWLITSNDNLTALRFYQRRGFSIVAVHPDAITEARKLKPNIPALGNDNIPIRDEIELEKRLDAE